MKKLLCVLSFVALAIAAPPPPTGAWSFEEGSGTNVADSSGSGLNGFSTAAWGPGKVGKAAVLSGTNKHYIRMNVPKDKQPGKGSFTIAFWANPTTYDIESKQKQRRIFGFDRWPWYFVVCDLTGEGKINLYSGYRADSNTPGLATGCSTQKPLPLGQWTHFAAVCDREAGKMRVYFNGALDAEMSPPKDWLEKADISGDQPFTVGSSWQSFAGSVDEVKYWKKALTADDIKAVAGAK